MTKKKKAWFLLLGKVNWFLCLVLEGFFFSLFFNFKNKLPSCDSMELFSLMLSGLWKAISFVYWGFFVLFPFYYFNLWLLLVFQLFSASRTLIILRLVLVFKSMISVFYIFNLLYFINLICIVLFFILTELVNISSILVIFLMLITFQLLT